MAGLLAIINAACEHNDIGHGCPQLLGDQDSGTAAGTRVETQEVVQQDVTFPCDELICIATDGRAGYCSKRCREDAGCPSGFECRTIQSIGPFAGEMFCAWKRCDSRSDCGSTSEFCCVPAPSPEAGQELKLCDFKDGKCP
jgi:hypothetical protein